MEKLFIGGREVVAHPTTFYVENKKALDYLPTTTKSGANQFKNFNRTDLGSVCYVLEQDGLSVYMLRTGGWVEV